VFSALVENSRNASSEEKKKLLSQIQSTDAKAIDACKNLDQSMKDTAFLPTSQDFQLLLTMMNQA
jgi:hypothetical protein